MEGDDVGMNRIMLFKWVSSIIFIIQAVQINATTAYAIEWKRSLNLPYLQIIIIVFNVWEITIKVMLNIPFGDERWLYY